jgi:DNA polymerase-3 subunit gamma/tau
MAVEIALLKAARPDLDPSSEGLLRRVERLETRIDKGPRAAGPAAAGDPPPPAVAEASSGSVPPAAPPAAETDDEDDEGSTAAPKVEPTPRDDPAEDSPGDPPGRGLELDEVRRVWPAVLDQLRQSAPALAATFEGARPVGLDEDGLRIGFPANSTFNKRKAEAPERRDLVSHAFEAVLGQKIRPAYVVLDGEEAEGEAPKGAIDHDELVARLKSEFDAEEVG